MEDEFRDALGAFHKMKAVKGAKPGTDNRPFLFG